MGTCRCGLHMRQSGGCHLSRGFLTLPKSMLALFLQTLVPAASGSGGNILSPNQPISRTHSHRKEYLFISTSRTTFCRLKRHGYNVYCIQ